MVPVTKLGLFGPQKLFSLSPKTLLGWLALLCVFPKEKWLFAHPWSYICPSSFSAWYNLSSSFTVLKILNSRWLVGSSVSSAASAVPFRISSAMLVVAPNPILLIISGPASGVFSAWRKWLILRRRTFYFKSFWSVIVWYSSLGPIVGIGTSRLERPPPLCFFAGSLKKMARAIFDILKHLTAFLGHILGLLAT